MTYHVATTPAVAPEDLSVYTPSAVSSLFSKLAHRIQSIQGERFPLHVGDTWLQPAAGARMEDLSAQYPTIEFFSYDISSPGPAGNDGELQEGYYKRGET